MTTIPVEASTLDRLSRKERAIEKFKDEYGTRGTLLILQRAAEYCPIGMGNELNNLSVAITEMINTE